jgi:hypothetical protein
MNFRILGLPADRFAHLNGRTDDELRAQGVLRFRIDKPHSAPDRISLRDAEPGESVLLLNHEHLDVDTPYRSRHAIYVIEGEQRTFDAVNEVPDVMRRRVLALRAFDDKGMMVDADIVDGRETEQLIERLFANPQAVYLHAHYAKRGCFAARIARA